MKQPPALSAIFPLLLLSLAASGQPPGSGEYGPDTPEPGYAEPYVGPR